MSDTETARNKHIVRRLVQDVLNSGNLDVIDELFAPGLAAKTKAWIAPFLNSLPDTAMEIVDLVAEGDRIAARLACSGTHAGERLGHPPAGRRFERIDEASFYRFRAGRIVESWGVKDTLTRLEQPGPGSARFSNHGPPRGGEWTPACRPHRRNR